MSYFYGVIKMNIDTTRNGPCGKAFAITRRRTTGTCKRKSVTRKVRTKPNKKFYDPRAWMRSAELATVKRLQGAYEDLNAIGACAK